METNNTETDAHIGELVITRVFNAPVETVWNAWSQPDQMKQWWGPENFTVPHFNMNFRVGGTYLSCMRSPDGQDFWSTGKYREIVPMERIVCTDSSADENGNIVPVSYYGMKQPFPLELLLTITFEDLDGKTRLTIRHTGIPKKDDGGAYEGWNSSLDKLAALVEVN